MAGCGRLVNNKPMVICVGSALLYFKKEIIYMKIAILKRTIFFFILAMILFRSPHIKAASPDTSLTGRMSGHVNTLSRHKAAYGGSLTCHGSRHKAAYGDSLTCHGSRHKAAYGGSFTCHGFGQKATLAARKTTSARKKGKGTTITRTRKKAKGKTTKSTRKKGKRKTSKSTGKKGKGKTTKSTGKKGKRKTSKSTGKKGKRKTTKSTGKKGKRKTSKSTEKNGKKKTTTSAGKKIKHSTALIGHRGYSSVYAENTLSAFYGAYANGFKGIEMDVMETRSGDLLIFHDMKLIRLCGVDGEIRDLTEQTRLNYKINGQYKILTLQEALEAVRNKKGPILLHLKEYKNYGYLPTQEGMKRIAGIIKQYKLEDRVIIFGARYNIKRFAGKYGLQYGVLFLGEDLGTIKKFAAWAKRHKVGLVCFVHMSALAKDAKAKIKVIHDQDLKAGMYYTLTNKDMKKLKKLGVDYALSDYKLQ